MRLATWNVENLFERAKAMNLPSWSDGKAVLQDWVALNDLIEQEEYSPATQKKLLELMAKHSGLATKGTSEYIILRENRGKLLKRPRGKPVEVAATGRKSWVGWFELLVDPVNEQATYNTGRIMKLLTADVLCVVEAENRVGLQRFNDSVLPNVKATPYAHVMLIDGNDERGIDVGVLCRAGLEIVHMRSHIDDADNIGEIFSRDCAEYEIRTPSGNMLLLLLNHLKSKGYGDPKASKAKRLRQATRIREIYDERAAAGYEYIAIVGDFNTAPTESELQPLLGAASGLIDITAHKDFKADKYPGTYGNGNASDKIDYILMSPALAAKVVEGGVERHGVWGGKNGDRFDRLPEITQPEEAASDHAALWVELDI